jgi:hypothetical protein
LAAIRVGAGPIRSAMIAVMMAIANMHADARHIYMDLRHGRGSESKHRPTNDTQNQTTHMVLLWFPSPINALADNFVQSFMLNQRSEPSLECKAVENKK